MKKPLFAVRELKSVFVSKDVSQADSADGRTVACHYEPGHQHPLSFGFYAKDFFFIFVADDKIGDANDAVGIVGFPEMQGFEAPK